MPKALKPSLQGVCLFIDLIWVRSMLLRYKGDEFFLEPGVLHPDGTIPPSAPSQIV